MTRSGYRYRSLLQFRLRTMLVLVLLASFAMAWWHNHLDSYREQHQAAAAIAKYARHIVYRPGQPKWMRYFSDEQVFKDVVHLSFQSRRRFSDEEMVHLAKMPRLGRLSLHNTRVTDAGLQHLSKLTQLDTLSLESTAVTDDGLLHLSGLSRLRMLQLNNTRVTRAGLKHLSDLRELERLEIATMALKDEDLETLLRLSSLKDSEFVGSELSEEGYARLSALQALESLRLHGDRISGLRLQDLPNLSSLHVGAEVRGLRLHNLPKLARFSIAGGVPDNTILRDLPRLKKLDLSRQPLSGAALKSLTSLSGLQVLDLSHSRTCAQDEHAQPAWSHLAELDSIRELHLSGTGFSGEALQHLSNLRHLRVLTLAGNPIDGKELEHLRKLPNLTALDLTGTRCFETGLGRHTSRGNLRRSRLFGPAVIPHAGIGHLLSLKRLESLYLGGTGVAWEEVVMLRDLPELDLLGLAAKWSDEELAAIRKELPTTTLTGYDVWQNRWFFRDSYDSWPLNSQYVPTRDELLRLEKSGRPSRVLRWSPSPPVRTTRLPR